MENRKTAEEVLQGILEANKPVDLRPTIKKLIYKKTGTEQVLQAMHTFAEQEKEVWSCEFLEWVMKNGYYLGWVGIWYDSCGREVCTSTAQLYAKFKLERDGK